MDDRGGSRTEESHKTGAAVGGHGKWRTCLTPARWVVAGLLSRTPWAVGVAILFARTVPALAVDTLLPDLPFKRGVLAPLLGCCVAMLVIAAGLWGAMWLVVRSALADTGFASMLRKKPTDPSDVPATASATHAAVTTSASRLSALVRSTTVACLGGACVVLAWAYLCVAVAARAAWSVRVLSGEAISLIVVVPPALWLVACGIAAGQLLYCVWMHLRFARWSVGRSALLGPVIGALAAAMVFGYGGRLLAGAGVDQSQSLRALTGDLVATIAGTALFVGPVRCELAPHISDLPDHSPTTLSETAASRLQPRAR